LKYSVSGGVLAVTGAAAGIVLAAAASRVMGTLLYGIRPSDITTYLAATGLLFGVALLACLIPSRRATSIDPTEALRAQ
jgi:ABC-type antimicrobial peptide transport system permease subunit